MIVKVCGMREAENIAAVSQLGLQMMGFILFDRSPRYVSDVAPSTPLGVKRVGVFVNAQQQQIEEMVERHNLDVAQLHGSESVELCRELRSRGLMVIKAISISTHDDMKRTTEYDGSVDYLLFDTKCAEHGGSGRRFDWSILDSYCGTTPFLLSGGIDEESADEILTIQHTAFAGVDLNSRFEISPALKDIDKLTRFLEKIKHTDNE